MKKTIRLFFIGFWMGLLLAHNPWWVSAIAVGVISIVVIDRVLRVRSFTQLKEEWPVRYRWLRRQLRLR